MKINFLAADVPLTKRISQQGKDAYPLVSRFTSFEEEVSTPVDLFNAVKKHALQNHCLLKGQLTRPLMNESRKGTTKTDAQTQWICLDFDRHEADDINSELAKLNLGDVTYTLQYSASHGLDENTGTISAHVFMLLEQPVPAPTLKAWLMDMNLTVFRDGLRLSRNKTTMSWPLDITTCQNDKLLYIAPPTFVKPLTDPLDKRIELVKRKYNAVPWARIGEKHINALTAQRDAALNELRKAEGLPARRAKTSWVGACEVFNKPDVCTVTGVRDSGEWIRLNLNGGDSWAYCHPKDNFELIYDFKSDSWFRTKELVPGYYQELVSAMQELNSTPTEGGDLILAFRDLTTANYYNGLWNPEIERLTLHKAKNETQLDHWMKSHGRVLGDFIPIWNILFNPREDWVVDEDEHRINLFVKTKYMRLTPEHTAMSQFPTIMGIIHHMLGETPYDAKNKTTSLLVEHFLNWFACIMQRSHKPRTAWVVHGIEGTGKGYFVNKIAIPLLGNNNSMAVTISNIEDDFNEWIANKLFVFVDEVDVDDFKEKGKASARLRNWITEPTMPVRKMQNTAISLPNYVSLLFSSNRPRPVYIPPSDRRYNIGNFQGTKLPPPDDKAVAMELEAFARWLLTHKADIRQADSIVHTEARERIQKLSITSVDETCKNIVEGDFEALWMNRPDEQLILDSGIINDHVKNAQAYALLIKEIGLSLLRNEPINKLTRDELQVILQYNVGGMPTTPNKFTSLLRHHNIELSRVRKNGSLHTGITVDWQITEDLKKELQTALNVNPVGAAIGSLPKLKKVKG